MVGQIAQVVVGVSLSLTMWVIEKHAHFLAPLFYNQVSLHFLNTNKLHYKLDEEQEYCDGTGF